MRILMLGWELPPHNSGGLGVACYHMAKALASHGADIDFVVPYSAYHPNTEFMNVHSATILSPLERYGLNAYDSTNIKDVALDDVNMSDLSDMRSVQKQYGQYAEKIALEIHPDIIHAHDWLTIEAGMRAKEVTGAPLIVHVHATEFDRCGSDSGNPLVHEIEYNGLMMADRIIAVSEFTKQIIVDKYHIPSEKIDVVHNALDIESLNNGYVHDFSTYKYLEVLKTEGYTVISIVTRLTIQKGLTHLIRAVAKACSRYDKFAFLIAGDGEQRDELIELTAELGISDRVFFAGFVRGKQWRDVFSVGDVFVMSSRSEPFGLTALEAAYHDNVVILTKQCGAGEVLKSVFKYDYWDEDRLADQLVGIATLPVLKDTLRQNVKNEYNKITWYDLAKKMMDIYSSMHIKAVA